MASESIAHSASGLMDYWLRAHSDLRNNCWIPMVATTVYETKIGVGATSQTPFNCKTWVKLRLRCRLVQCLMILNFLCLVKRIKLFWRTWLLFLKKFLHILYLLFLKGVSGSSNGSSEHLIRAKLLENYDKIVLPVTGKKMDVRFKLRIVKLLKVVSITLQRNRNRNQNCRNFRRGTQRKSG